jgi:hypothetical protein
VVPWLLAISGCGRTLSEGDAPADAPLAGAAGVAGGADGGASQLGGAGTAGGVSAGAAGSVARPSFGGSAGQGPLDTTCGGDLVGNWGAIPRSDDQLVPVEINDCFNLGLVMVGGQVRAVAMLPAPERRASYLLFDTNGGFDATGSFKVRDVFSGPLVVDYTEACVKTPEGPVSCEQLTEGLAFLGTSDKTFDQVTCVAQPDGCRCTFEMSYTKLAGGFYTLDPAAAGQVAFTDLGSGNSLGSYTYCVDETGLRFGDGFERLSPVGASSTFSKADCHDGQHGPAEAGLDCGPVCDRVCP